MLLARLPIFRRTKCKDEPRICGWVEGMRGRRLHGWAFDPQQPTLRLRLSVETAEGELVKGCADCYRVDVHAAFRLTDGYCGFSIPFRQSGSPSVVVEGFGVVLPSVVTNFPEGLPKIASLKQFDLQWAVDPIRESVSGWITGLATSTRRRTVRMELRGQYVDGMRATLYRPDCERHFGDGFLGFSFTLPKAEGRYRLVDDLSNARLTSFVVRQT